MAIIMEDDNTSKNELTDEEPIGVDQTPLSIPVQNKCNVTTPELVITPQKRRGMKRRAQPSKRKRNFREQNEADGQEHCTSRGKIKMMRQMRVNAETGQVFNLLGTLPEEYESTTCYFSSEERGVICMWF